GFPMMWSSLPTGRSAARSPFAETCGMLFIWKTKSAMPMSAPARTMAVGRRDGCRSGITQSVACAKRGSSVLVHKKTLTRTLVLMSARFLFRFGGLGRSLELFCRKSERVGRRLASVGGLDEAKRRDAAHDGFNLRRRKRTNGSAQKSHTDAVVRRE